MHELETVSVSVDSSVIVDFYLTGNLPFFEGVFAGRRLMSDFVEEELGESQIRVLGSEIVTLTKDEEWAFFAELRKRRPGLGPVDEAVARSQPQGSSSAQGPNLFLSSATVIFSLRSACLGLVVFVVS